MKVSFIVHVTNAKRCKNTIRSLWKVSSKTKGELEIILLCSEKEKEELRLAECDAEFSDKAVYLTKLDDGYNVNSLLEYAGGEYVAFLEAGVTFSDNILEELENVTADEMRDIYIVPVAKKKRKEKKYQIFSKINTNGRINLEQSADSQTDIYSAYLFRREALMETRLETKGFFWGCQECLVKMLLKNNAEIPVLGNADGNYDSFFEEYNFQKKAYDKLAEYMLKVFQQCSQYKSENGVPLWYKNTVVRYFRNLTDDRRVSEKDAEKYRKHVHDILALLDSETLASYKDWNIFFRVFWLEKLVHKKVTIQYMDGKYGYYLGERLIAEEAENPVVIEFIKLNSDYVEIECEDACAAKDADAECFLEVNGERYFGQVQERKHIKYWMGEPIYDKKTICYRIPLEKCRKKYSIRAGYLANSMEVMKSAYLFGKFAPIYEGIKESYYKKNGWIICYNRKEAGLEILKADLQESLRSAWRYNYALLMKSTASRKAFLIHCVVRAAKIFCRKDIWLVSDRVNRGNDNGEAFMEYLDNHRERLKGKKIYFMMEKACEDAERIGKYVRLVEPFSWKHRILHLMSEYVISAQANEPVVNPFRGRSIYYKHLLQDVKIVFLQHGVIKDDMSDWLNRYNRNLFGFVVSTKPEWKSILDYNYCYKKENVWLTGLPRYDKMYHDERKYITVMPTWRKDLMSGIDSDTALWKLSDHFGESRYFQFYNALLNDEDLITYAKERGYRLCFLQHPIMLPFVKDYFTRHEDVIFWDESKPYSEAFAESSLLLTDYSSVAFDFAYLRKPVLYTHFDRDEFFNGTHSYVEGYFDYAADGFGEVALTLEDTINYIKEYIDRDCELKDIYRDRINATFAFDDRECSKRITDLLLAGVER